jgi:hypothetical protein
MTPEVEDDTSAPSSKATLARQRFWPAPSYAAVNGQQIARHPSEGSHLDCVTYLNMQGVAAPPLYAAKAFVYDGIRPFTQAGFP